MELKQKIKIYHAIKEKYEEELENVNQNIAVVIFKGEKKQKKWELS